MIKNQVEHSEFAGYDPNGVTFKRSELTEARVLQIFDGSNALSVKIDSCNELLVAFDNQCLIRTHSADQTDWVLFESPDKNVFIENGCTVMETETRR